MFAYYLSKYKDNFVQNRRIHPELLTFISTISIIAEIVFLIFYGFKVVWWSPIVLFAAANAIYFAVLANFMERFLGHGTIIKYGFFGLPIFGFLMFKTIPI
jgi:hypothetical protein